MAQGYDSDIQLSVGLSYEDAKDQAEKLGKSIKGIFDSVDSSKMTTAMKKAQAAMSKTATQINEVTADIAALEDQAGRTEDYKILSDSVKVAKEEIKQFAEALHQAEAAGDTKKVEEYNAAIADTRNLIAQAEEEMSNLAAQGKLGFTQEDADRLDSYYNKLGDLNNTARLNIEAFNALSREVTEGSNAMNEMTLSAGNVNPVIEETVNKFNTLGFTMEQIQQRMKQLEDAGVGVGYEEYDNLARKLSYMKKEYDECAEKLQQYKDNLMGVAKTSEKTSIKFSELAKAAKKVITAMLRFGGVGPVMDSLSNKVGSLLSKFKGVSSSANNFGDKIGAIVKKFALAGLGVVSITSLVNKIKSAISSGITTMAKMNNGVNATNIAMTQLTSSLNLLKGSLAAAFVPILTTVSPILSSFMQQLAGVINFIGMFIAKLTGAKTYMKAVYKATDYAGSQNKGSGSKGKTQEEKQKEVDEKRAKEAAKAEEKQAKAAEKLAKAQEKANKQLAGFDELNNLAIQDAQELDEYKEKQYDDPTGGGGGAGDPFGLEEVSLDGLEWDWDAIKQKAEELGRKFADFLNNIFADENLAKNIGKNIAEALNTALHFVYGFVDQLDWKQMGHWLGTLVYEGIKTFEWEMLGETIALTLNGIANSIIGFFERYPVGTLGASISEMLNRAIKRLDAKLIGTSVLELLQAPLIELRTVLTKTNIELAGEKVSEFFHQVFNSRGLKGETLGVTIGKMLGTAINAAIDFLLGLDLTQLIVDIGMFFTDIISAAAKEIKWMRIFEAIVEGIGEIKDGIETLLNIWINSLLIGFAQKINDFVGFNLINQKIIESLETTNEALRDGLTTTEDILKGSGTEFIALMNKIGDGTAYSRDQLIRWQEAGGLTNDQIEAMIQAMKDYAAQNHLTFDEAKLGLEGYKGDWETFRDVSLGVMKENQNELLVTKDAVNDLRDTTEELALKSQNVGDRISKTAKEVGEEVDHTTSIGTDHLGVLDAAFKASQENAKTQTDSIVESLDGVDNKSEDVKTSFTDMSETVQTNLDAITKVIGDWYDKVKKEYFDYDKWFEMIDESMVTALKDCVDAMIKYWSDSFNDWWNNIVIPTFEQSKWDAEFNHVYVAAESTFTKVANIIKAKMNEATQTVQSSVSTMAASIATVSKALSDVGDVLNSLNELDVSGKISQLQVNVNGLATGAVIPPNHKFLAVLGDQKQGTNVEAPLDTIKQAVAETLSAMNYRGGDDRDIVLQIDGYELFRIVRNQSEQFRNSTGYGVL